jgi:hypothetical protein
MNRIKFFAFALVVVGLWALHLSQASSALSEPGLAANNAVAGAPAAVALALEAQRSELQAAVLKLAGSPAVLNAARPGAKVEPPGIDRFAAVRPVVSDALSEPNKGRVVIAVVNEAGALVAQGSVEPAAPPEGFDVARLASSGSAGAVAAFNGAPTLFLATPLLAVDKAGEVRPVGSALVGLPLLLEASSLDAVARAQGLRGLALLQDGKSVVSAGDAASVMAAVGKVKAGALAPVDVGPARTLGPLALPLFVSAPVLEVAVRQPVAGTPFEVLATASARGPLEALSTYQTFALGGLVGLLLLSIVFGLLIRGGAEEEGARMVMPQPVPVPPAPLKRDESPAKAPLAFAEQAPAPEASPDDFDFPVSGPSLVMAGHTPVSQPLPQRAPPPPVFEPEPEHQAEQEPEGFPTFAPPPPSLSNRPPPAAPTPPPPAPPPAAPPPRSAPPPARSAPPPPVVPEEDDARTVAFPAVKPPPPPAAAAPMSDPFAMAASQFPSEGGNPFDEASESTRVAAVPHELIKQARAGAAAAAAPEKPVVRAPTTSMPKVSAVSAPPAPAAGFDEERHFSEVFRDFVATRERCGEPADGLTFEKFKAKLLKNKEQLVAKYQCRSVRFQVHVKDGKAALKATPIKD